MMGDVYMWLESYRWRWMKACPLFQGISWQRVGSIAEI